MYVLLMTIGENKMLKLSWFYVHFELACSLWDAWYTGAWCDWLMVVAPASCQIAHLQILKTLLNVCIMLKSVTSHRGGNLHLGTKEIQINPGSTVPRITQLDPHTPITATPSKSCWLFLDMLRANPDAIKKLKAIRSWYFDHLLKWPFCCRWK